MEIEFQSQNLHLLYIILVLLNLLFIYFIQDYIFNLILTFVSHIRFKFWAQNKLFINMIEFHAISLLFLYLYIYILYSKILGLQEKVQHTSYV